MKQRSTTKKQLETSSNTTSVWNWKNSKNKRSKNQRKKNVSKRSSNKPLMPVANYSAAEEVKFLYESKSGKTTRNSMNFDHNSMNFDHQQIQLPAIAQWAILPLSTNFYFFKTKLIQAVNALTKYLHCLLEWSVVWHFATPEWVFNFVYWINFAIQTHSFDLIFESRTSCDRFD